MSVRGTDPVREGRARDTKIPDPCSVPRSCVRSFVGTRARAVSSSRANYGSLCTQPKGESGISRRQMVRADIDARCVCAAWPPTHSHRLGQVSDKARSRQVPWKLAARTSSRSKGPFWPRVFHYLRATPDDELLCYEIKGRGRGRGVERNYTERSAKNKPPPYSLF